MKFNVNTKPLISAINYCLVKANISNANGTSLIAQITATKNELIINHSAVSILSEVVIKGHGDGEYAAVIIDSLLLKQIIGTIKSDLVTLEFTESSIIIHAGKSVLYVSKLYDVSDDSRIPEPKKYSADSAYTINLAKWKYIKAHQLFAKPDISETTNNPVYSNVWFGSGSKCICGSVTNSLFAYSDNGDIQKPCMLTDTVVNMMVSMPDNAKITDDDETFNVFFETDAFSYNAQITPIFESENTGYYSSDAILGLMKIDSNNCVKTNINDFKTILAQAELLSTSRDPEISVEVTKDYIRCKDSRVDCNIKATSNTEITPYTVRFNPAKLKAIFSACPNPEIEISPSVIMDEDTNKTEITGLVIKSDDLYVVVGELE